MTVCVCVSARARLCVCMCGIVIERKICVQLAETALCRPLPESLGRWGSSLLSAESKRDRKSTFLNITNTSSNVFCFQENWEQKKKPSEWRMITNMWKRKTLGSDSCFFPSYTRSELRVPWTWAKREKESKIKGSDDRTWNLHTCLQLPWRKIRVCTNLKVFNDTKIYYQIKKM